MLYEANMADFEEALQFYVKTRGHSCTRSVPTRSRAAASLARPCFRPQVYVNVRTLT